MIRVNLQPRIRTEAAEGLQLSPLWAIALGIILVFGVGGVGYKVSWDITQAKSTINALDFQLRDFQKIIKEYADALDQKSYFTGKRDFVKGISENQKKWIEFFDALKKKTPKDVWLTKLDAARNGAYSVEGGTFSFSAIGYFMLQLNSIPAIKSVSLDQAAGVAGAAKEQGAGASLSLVAQLTKVFKITGSMSMGSAEATGTTPLPGAPAAPGAAPAPPQQTSMAR